MRLKRTGLMIITIICLLLNLTYPVFAENSTPYKATNMDVMIMPEYDTTDVLVVYSLDFTNNSSQPYTGEIRFPVPKGTTSNIVTEANGGDSHLAVKVEDKGNYSEFVWKPSQPVQPNGNYKIHLEYYYNPLPGTGSKSFEYQFNATVPVDRSKIYVYQPLKASDFKMEPMGQAMGTDKQGFQIYGLDSSSMAIGQTLSLKISYTKNDPAPSVQPQTSAGGTQSGEPSGKSQLSSAAILVPLVAIVFGIIFITVRALKRSDSEEEVLEKRTSRTKSSKNSPKGAFTQEKKKIRQMLLNGDIGEETYHELLAELEREYS